MGFKSFHLREACTSGHIQLWNIPHQSKSVAHKQVSTYRCILGEVASYARARRLLLRLNPRPWRRPGLVFLG